MHSNVKAEELAYRLAMHVRGVARGGATATIARKRMKRSWIVEKREAFYELSVTKESEKLKIKLLFTSRRPPAR